MEEEEESEESFYSESASKEASSKEASVSKKSIKSKTKSLKKRHIEEKKNVASRELNGASEENQKILIKLTDEAPAIFYLRRIR